MYKLSHRISINSIYISTFIIHILPKPIYISLMLYNLFNSL